MPELTLDTAQNLAIALLVVFIVLAVLSAWLVKKLVAKVISIALLTLLAFGVWSNRDSLEDCTDKVSAALEAGTSEDNECTLFGFTVTIPVPDSSV